jgi:hypothetical protein
LCLFGEFHKTTDGGRGDGDDASVVAGDYDMELVSIIRGEREG